MYGGGFQTILSQKIVIEHRRVPSREVINDWIHDRSHVPHEISYTKALSESSTVTTTRKTSDC